MPTDASRPLSIPRSVALWQQAVQPLEAGAHALRAFVDRVSVALSASATWQLMDDASRLARFAHTVRDIGGAPEATYSVASAREEWDSLQAACLRAATALSAEMWLFGDPTPDTHWLLITVLVALRGEIRTALTAGSSLSP